MRATIKTTHNERGFASIVVVLIMIVVLSLITIGFAQLARREQSNALDKQLANQAYYAAEAGINDVVSMIKSGATLPNTPTTCLTPPTIKNETIGASANNVSYSCVLLNQKPDDLLFQNVGPGQGKYVSFTPSAALSSLTVQWKSNSGKKDFKPLISKFAPVGVDPGKWGNSPGVIQFSLTPLDTYRRSDLIMKTYNVYLYPSAEAGSASYATYLTSTDLDNQAQIVAGNCSDAPNVEYNCSVTITGLPAPGTQPYAAHFVNYYDASDVRVTGKSGGTPVKFSDGQAIIDVTGKAKDVLKRIQVRVGLDSLQPGLEPDYALQVGSACKRISTQPSPGLTTYEAPGGFKSCNLDTGNLAD
ncbi:MAG: hypothetical protein JWO35_397 [Candidatus Saccharibacteria bacterium]|nr:hypothetical protein [Candidatus Saccharibacteria bacterium]